MSHRMPRRDLLLLAAGLLSGGIATRVLAAPVPSLSSGAIEIFPSEIIATVAGPAEGSLDFWAGRVLAALGRTLPPGTRLRPVTVGAADGVTGANRFEARTDPDGASLMLAPGAAALAWLVGDPRAKFDIGQWMPLMTGVVSGVVVARASAASLAAGREVRVATASVAGPDLAALLAMELLGARPVAVMQPAGLDTGARLRGLAAGRVDAVLLRGAAAHEGLRAGRFEPVFTLGEMDGTGRRVRDPAFPDVPHFAELCAASPDATPHGALFDAWRAVAAAVQLEFAAVLPPLTPAAMVALWRRAGGEATEIGELRQAAGAMAVRVAGGIASTTALAEATADTAALLALRGWLGTRLGFRPA